MIAAQYAGNKSFTITESQSVAPKADEVRLNVGYVGICGTDMHIYHGVMDGRVNPPQIIGHEMSGIVAELGSNVSNVAVGDQVVVRPLDYCNACPACDAGHSHVCHNLKFMGIDTPGAFQSNWTVKARTLHKLPATVSLKMGALVEPLAVACHDIRRARVVANEKVVVLGGGPIGQLVAAVAKSQGAEVLLSEINPTRLSFAQEQGVKTVNPKEENLVDVVKTWTDGKGADAVFEVSGVQAAIDIMTEVAAVRGRICMVAIHANKPQLDMFAFFWKELELLGARVYEHADFEMAISLMASKQIDVAPFITSVNSLPNIGDAFATIEKNAGEIKSLVSLIE
mgnify:CR=1 FL=1